MSQNNYETTRKVKPLSFVRPCVVAQKFKKDSVLYVKAKSNGNMPTFQLFIDGIPFMKDKYSEGIPAKDFIDRVFVKTSLYNHGEGEQGFYVTEKTVAGKVIEHKVHYILEENNNITPYDEDGTISFIPKFDDKGRLLVFESIKAYDKDGLAGLSVAFYQKTIANGGWYNKHYFALNYSGKIIDHDKQIEASLYVGFTVLLHNILGEKSLKTVDNVRDKKNIFIFVRSYDIKGEQNHCLGKMNKGIFVRD